MLWSGRYGRRRRRLHGNSYGYVWGSYELAASISKYFLTWNVTSQYSIYWLAVSINIGVTFWLTRGFPSHKYKTWTRAWISTFRWPDWTRYNVRGFRGVSQWKAKGYELQCLQKGREAIRRSLCSCRWQCFDPTSIAYRRRYCPTILQEASRKRLKTVLGGKVVGDEFVFRTGQDRILGTPSSAVSWNHKSAELRELYQYYASPSITVAYLQRVINEPPRLPRVSRILMNYSSATLIKTKRQ